MKTTMSFEFEGSDTDVIAQIKGLIAKLDPTAIVMEPAKVKASRPKRVLTEAERQVIRDRFAAGKAKAALARGEAVGPIRGIEVKPVAEFPSHGVKPAPKPVGVKSAPKPMPLKGRKVQAKPHAQ